MKNILLACSFSGLLIGCTTTRSVDDHSTHYNGCKITNYNGDTTKPHQPAPKPTVQTDKEYLQFLQEDAETTGNIPRPKPTRYQPQPIYSEPQYPLTVFIPDESRHNY